MPSTRTRRSLPATCSPSLAMGCIVKANSIHANTLPIACRWAAPRRRLPAALHPGGVTSPWAQLPFRVDPRPHAVQCPYVFD
jgi:hypothetical protein